MSNQPIIPNLSPSELVHFTHVLVKYSKAIGRIYIMRPGARVSLILSCR